MREYLHESGQHFGPVVENPARSRTRCTLRMPCDPVIQELFIFLFNHRLKIYSRLIAALFAEAAGFVKHVSDTSAHARGKVAACLAEPDHQTVGHVFAAMVPRTFDNCCRAGVAARKPFAGHSIKECLAAGSPIEHDITDENILFRYKGRGPRRINYDASARKPLANVVIGVALKFESHTFGKKRAKALARGPGEFESDGVVG